MIPEFCESLESLIMFQTWFAMCINHQNVMKMNAFINVLQLCEKHKKLCDGEF